MGTRKYKVPGTRNLGVECSMLTVRLRTLQVMSVHLNTGLYVRSGGVSTKSGYLGSETQPTSATGDYVLKSRMA